jgi:hypothetical protein
VAAYIETLQRQAAPPSVKQQMAAIGRSRACINEFFEERSATVGPARVGSLSQAPPS